MGSLRNDELNFKLIAENATKIKLITEIHLPYDQVDKIASTKAYVDGIQSLAMLSYSVYFFIKYTVTFFSDGYTDNDLGYSASCVVFQNNDWSKISTRITCQTMD